MAVNCILNEKRESKKINVIKIDSLSERVSGIIDVLKSFHNFGINVSFELLQISSIFFVYSCKIYHL